MGGRNGGEKNVERFEKERERMERDEGDSRVASVPISDADLEVYDARKG